MNAPDAYRGPIGSLTDLLSQNVKSIVHLVRRFLPRRPRFSGASM
jgi:hypothetical protein